MRMTRILITVAAALAFAAPAQAAVTKTVTIKLKAGKWKFYCPPHESSMFGFFTVK